MPDRALHRTRIALQISDFTYPGVAPGQLFERVVAQAVAAEQSGFDTVFVMDHFFQLPNNGRPEQEMFEAYTLLAALAARTSAVRLGTLVTGVTYRTPALLAKEVTAVDVISRGRALLGIGAAWFEYEHKALGFEYPPLTERYEHLVDALAICRGMFTQATTTYTGAHHSVVDAFNMPAPINGDIPIMIGGQGEKKTFRLAAEHADELNTPATFRDMPRKLDALQGHLDDIGRPREDITVTPFVYVITAPTHDQAVEKLRTSLATRGIDLDTVIADGGAAEQQVLGRAIYGDPDECVAGVRDVLALGLDGVVVSLTADGDDTEAIAMVGETLAKAFV
ncbi:MAG: TIGR03560 family F420-dependent LLM class oxidoreductase [Ilumatobacteraceae bacterium]